MPQGEKPRVEPEIIPPDRAERGAPRTRVFRTERVYIGKLGPLGTILAVLMTGILAAVMLILLFATFLIWVPLVVFFIVGAIVVGLMRTYFR